MMQLSDIKVLIHEGDIEKAIGELETILRDSPQPSDEVYYLLGNAYRKTGNWQLALNNYLSAIELNPESPAVEARDALIDILNFYNKDMYNQ